MLYYVNRLFLLIDEKAKYKFIISDITKSFTSDLFQYCNLMWFMVGC